MKKNKDLRQELSEKLFKILYDIVIAMLADRSVSPNQLAYWRGHIDNTLVMLALLRKDKKITKEQIVREILKKYMPDSGNEDRSK